MFTNINLYARFVKNTKNNNRNDKNSILVSGSFLFCWILWTTYSLMWHICLIFPELRFFQYNKPRLGYSSGSYYIPVTEDYRKMQSRNVSLMDNTGRRLTIFVLFSCNVRTIKLHSTELSFFSYLVACITFCVGLTRHVL